MRLIFVSMLLAFTILANAQTCIIVYVSNNGIVAGADRLYHQTTAGSGHSVYFDRKIFPSRKGAWALSGADFYDSIHSICRQITSGSQSVATTCTRLEQRMQTPAVKKAMHYLFASASPDQKKRFKANLTEVVFFLREEGAYKAYRLTISMPGILENKETLRFETDSIVPAKNTVGVFVLGHSASFSKNLHPEQWTHPASVIRSLIKRQAAFTPKEVSAQSDLLQITLAGPQWIPDPGRRSPR